MISKWSSSKPFIIFFKWKNLREICVVANTISKVWTVYNSKRKPCLVANACNLSILSAKAGRWVWCLTMLYIKILSQLHQNTALLVGYYPGSETKAWLENKREWVSQWTLTYTPGMKKWSVAFRFMYFWNF